MLWRILPRPTLAGEVGGPGGPALPGGLRQEAAATGRRGCGGRWWGEPFESSDACRRRIARSWLRRGDRDEAVEALDVIVGVEIDEFVGGFAGLDGADLFPVDEIGGGFAAQCLARCRVGAVPK